MKFIKSDLAKKLIIVLIVLLLFNTLYPSMLYAVDFGGILLQPFYWLLLGIIIPTDLSMGLTIFMREFTQNDLDKWVEKILAGDSAGDETTDGVYIPELDITYGTKLRDWFIGPDTIFSRKNSIT